MYHGILDGVNKVAIKMLQPGTFKQDALDAFCNEASPACQMHRSTATLLCWLLIGRAGLPVAAGSRLGMGMITLRKLGVIADLSAAPRSASQRGDNARSFLKCGVSLPGYCETCTHAIMEAAKRKPANMHMYRGSSSNFTNLLHGGNA